MDKLKQIAALTSLNDMMKKGWMNICTVDAVAELLGVNPKCEAYAILKPLHCVSFDKMPEELASAIPGLIQACLGVEPIFQFKTLETEHGEKTIVRRLLGGT